MAPRAPFSFAESIPVSVFMSDERIGLSTIHIIGIIARIRHVVFVTDHGFILTGNNNSFIIFFQVSHAGMAKYWLIQPWQSLMTIRAGEVSIFHFFFAIRTDSHILSSHPASIINHLAERREKLSRHCFSNDEKKIGFSEIIRYNNQKGKTPA